MQIERLDEQLVRISEVDSEEELLSLTTSSDQLIAKLALYRLIELKECIFDIEQVA